MGDAAWLLQVATIKAALDESCPEHVDVVLINQERHVMITSMAPPPENHFFAFCVARSRADSAGPMAMAEEFLKRLRNSRKRNK